MDRIDAMAAFLRVAEMESFTAAARHLGLPKASVSQAVSRLEASVGVRLLARTTRRVQLTPDGAAFADRCRDLLADAEELAGMFTSEAALTGRLRVDMPSRMARFVVIPQLPSFLAAHPALQLELGTTDRAVDVVREGYDCVVRAGNLPDSGLVSRRLEVLPHINVASPAYLRAHGTPRSIHDLDAHYLVHYVSSFGATPDGFEYEEDGAWRERPMRALLTVNSAEAYVAACVAGLGIIQVPRSTLTEDLKSGRLVEVLPEFVARPMPVHFLYPHRRQLPRRVRVFLTWLEHCLGRDGAPNTG